MPDPASSPVNVTPTGWLNQPAASAGRAVTSSLTVGAVASYGICTAPEPVFPALSLHEPDTEPMPSGPEYVPPPEQPASPEALSEPPNETPTGRLYQPFESGPRSGDPPTLGPVESYLIVAPPLAGLPATSVQLPGTDAEPPSGPEYVTAEHPATPDRLSVAVKLTATGRLYQPFASGARPRLEPVIAGPVSSYLNGGARRARAVTGVVAARDRPGCRATVGTGVRPARASGETRTGTRVAPAAAQTDGCVVPTCLVRCPGRASPGDRWRNRVDANIDRLLVSAFAVRSRARERRRPLLRHRERIRADLEAVSTRRRSVGHGERHRDRRREPSATRGAGHAHRDRWERSLRHRNERQRRRRRRRRGPASPQVPPHLDEHSEERPAGEDHREQREHRERRRDAGRLVEDESGRASQRRAAGRAGPSARRPSASPERERALRAVPPARDAQLSPQFAEPPREWMSGRRALRERQPDSTG